MATTIPPKAPPSAADIAATTATASGVGTARVASKAGGIVVPDAVALEAMKLPVNEALKYLADHVPALRLAMANGMADAHRTPEQNHAVASLRETIMKPPKGGVPLTPQAAEQDARDATKNV